jgi:hypothetical protein
VRLQLTPPSCIFLATEPVDFRKSIEELAAVCRQVLGDNPLEGRSTFSEIAPRPRLNSYFMTARATGS